MSAFYQSEKKSNSQMPTCQSFASEDFILKSPSIMDGSVNKHSTVRESALPTEESVNSRRSLKNYRLPVFIKKKEKLKSLKTMRNSKSAILPDKLIEPIETPSMGINDEE